MVFLQGSDRSISPVPHTPNLNDTQIAAIAMAADKVAGGLPELDPKPINLKKPVNQEIQVEIMIFKIYKYIFCMTTLHLLFSYKNDFKIFHSSLLSTKCCL